VFRFPAVVLHQGELDQLRVLEYVGEVTRSYAEGVAGCGDKRLTVREAIQDIPKQTSLR
jgi:hypothetical protein